MGYSSLNIGIIFNALVSGIIAATAASLSFFLFKRYQRLTSSMQAYNWFWLLMLLAWIFLTVKYSLIGIGYLGKWIHAVDLVLQTALFCGGIPLIYYASIRVFSDHRLAKILGAFTILPIAVAVWLIIQPGGLVLREPQFFSAKSELNSGSLMIFNMEVGIILMLLIYDVFTRLRRWRIKRDQNIFYESLYSSAIIFYLVLGSIEQSALIKNWPVIIFRVLYTAIFLFVYLLVTQHETINEKFLLDESEGLA